MQVSTEEGWKKLSEKDVETTTIQSFEAKEIAVTDINAEIWKGVTKHDVMKYYLCAPPYVLNICETAR